MLPQLKVSSIQWNAQGSSILDGALSQAYLRQVAGLEPGQEILKLPLERIREQILQVHWVKEVQIERRLPATIRVNYTLYDVAALVIRDHKPWLMSDQGQELIALDLYLKQIHSIDPTQVSPHQLALSGLKKGGDKWDVLLELPVLQHNSDASVQKGLIDFGRQIQQKIGSRISKIHELLGHTSFMTARIELKSKGSPQLVSIYSAPKTSSVDFDRLDLVLAYLIRNNLDVASIDLRLGKKVVVNTGIRR